VEVEIEQVSEGQVELVLLIGRFDGGRIVVVVVEDGSVELTFE
jgi:hypothetical protein